MAITRVTVIGAGNMGSGIAQAFAQAGLDVTLNDLSAEAVQKGLQRIEGPLRKRADAGKTTHDAVDAIMARLTADADLATAVADADLVVEAVFEDMKVKKEVFANASKHAKAECVFATNTSSLSVTEMARVTDRPQRFAGLHFFFPAAINKLVEVVGGDDTEPGLVDELVDLMRSVGKVPIRTADANGFAVNRFFVPWVNESVRLLEEGVADIPTIEAATKKGFGVGMGPFELMNVTGVPISLHAQTTLYEAFGDAYAPAELLRKQVEKGENWDLTGEPNEAKFDLVNDRLFGVTFGIVCHLVDEGVATKLATDKGATVGLRWPKGPFQMMNDLGTARALELVESVHAKWGDAFPVPASLRAQDGKPWHLPKVRAEVSGPVATVTIDRPEALNALNEDVLQDLDAALDEVMNDDAVRAVVLTGEGKAFVAGADIKAMATKSAMEARPFTQLGQRVFRRIGEAPKPVIAAVNGFALGGGCELALACDIVLAGEKAVFGLPETGLGIIPGFGGTQRLTRLVGPQVAKWLVFTGAQVDAAKAKELGIALDVFPQRDLLRVAQDMARTVATKAPVATALAKDAVNRALDGDLAGGLAYEAELAALTFATDDQKEGMRAFVERRKPEWQGR